MNGVSKKLCITAGGILAVTQLADGAPDKWKYAVLITVMVGIYKIVQGVIDYGKSCGVQEPTE